jgi:hypothetical protein
MRRVVSLAGTVLVLLCLLLVLVAAPVVADDSNTPPPAAADGQYKGPADDQYKPIDKPGGPKGPVDAPNGVKPDTVVGKQVPNTGGPPIIVLAAAGALLSVALIAGRGILRR